ncbi:hypothetical protein ACRTDU_03930 [Sunxiuqinia elliptica]
MKNQVLDAAQRNLSSDFMGYEGQKVAYIGKDDPSLSFTGNGKSFMNEDAGSKSYSITVSNMGNAADDRVLALHPGFLTELADMTDTAGNPAAAIVADGAIIEEVDKQVICTGKPKKISHFKAFVNRNPTRFTGLKMQVNNTDQFDEAITVKKISPFQSLGDDTIEPGNYKTSNQTDDKRVEIPLEDFQLDDQTLLVFTLKAGRSVTFTFVSGAIKNQAAELHTKAAIARGNVRRAI